MIDSRLPKEWDWRKAGECMDVRDGTHDSPKYIDKGYPLVTSKNLVNGKIDFSTCSYISKLDFDAISKRSAVNNGDILYAMIGTIGNPVIVKKSSDFAIKNVALFKFNNGSVSNKYVFYFLNSDLTVRQFKKNSRGGTQKFVSLTNIRNLKIPVPPLAEQQKIAEILDAADALRQKDQQLIDHYTTLSQSLFLEMFGDPVTNPMGWEVKLFGDVGRLDRGKSKHRPRNDPKLLGGLHPLIQTGDVANSGGYITEHTSTYSDIGLKQSKKWDAGTLCITIAANIAKTGILTFDACFPDSVVGFMNNEKTNIEYIQYWLSFLQKILEETAPMAAQKNINLKILKELEIPLPPITLQNQFAQYIEKIEKQKQQAQASLEKSEALFNSLLQRAFKGELTH